VDSLWITKIGQAGFLKAGGGSTRVRKG